jgi:hypothetical protein
MTAINLMLICQKGITWFLRDNFKLFSYLYLQKKHPESYGMLLYKDLIHLHRYW